MTTHAVTDIFRPKARRHALIYDILLVVSGSALLALASQISVRLPFSPVPITAQTLAVLLIGAVMGSKRGALTILAYLAEGASGLPVFAGGLSGIAYIVGPTGGYLLGFVAAAFVTGLCSENGWNRRIITTTMAMLLGSAAIYLGGLTWLGLYVGYNNAVSFGLIPFIAGDILKVVIAVSILTVTGRMIGDR